jgi:hypothetical protein
LANIRFWSYLARILIEWKMLQIKFIQKNKTRILFSVRFYNSRVTSDGISQSIAEHTNAPSSVCLCGFVLPYVAMPALHSLTVLTGRFSQILVASRSQVTSRTDSWSRWTPLLECRTIKLFTIKRWMRK